MDGSPQVRSQCDPDPEGARDLVETGLADGTLITVFGRCEVTYEGRASSYLGVGDRLVVLKPDGTLLVHTHEQRTPVNWQPPGCTHEALLADGRLAIRSTRSSPSERIEIDFVDVFQVSLQRVTERSDIELAGSEEDLRQRILDRPDLVEEGFRPLATERETAAGAVDIYGEDADGNAVVLELKRRRVGPAAVGQLTRYVTAVSSDLSDDGTARGLLVAPSITERAARLLDSEGLEFVSLTPDVGSEPGHTTLDEFADRPD